MRILLIIAALLLSTPSRADDWPAAHPNSWHSTGFSKLVEVFPPKSRHNPSDKPVAYVYDIGYAGTAWNVAATLVWKGPLVNQESPYEAILSSDGWLVTLDDWANLGFHHAVVVYDPAGKLVASRKLDDLLPADVRDRDRSTSSRYWRKGAKYVFDTKQKLVQIWIANAGVLQVSLADGKHKYFAANAAPKRSPNAEDTEVWSTSLRFSSVTDVLAAQKPKRP